MSGRGGWFADADHDSRMSFCGFICPDEMNMKLLLAMQAGVGGMSWLGIAPLLFIFAIFYFLLIMPQQRRQKKWQTMLDALKTGDKVTTSGGLRGTIIALKDDAVHLRVPPDNLRVEVTKASVVQVTTPEEEAKAK
jgi:preprotein translocase subunit YajC